MQNAFKPKNNGALNGLGALIREWTLDPASRPAHQMEGARLCIIDEKDFVAAMKTKGFDKDVDYELRGNIRAVELVLPTADRFTIAMPETEALSRFETPGKHDVEIPAIYGAVEPWRGNPTPKPLSDADPASYTITVDDKTFAAFVDPYMAAYCCTQCF